MTPTESTEPAGRSEEEALAERPAGHRYGVMDGRGGQWLVESCDEYPEPSPIGLVDDILRYRSPAQVREREEQWERSTRVLVAEHNAELREAQAAALREAARRVRFVRENGLDALPERVTGHPTAEHFEKWLLDLAAAARADSLSTDGGDRG